MIIKWAWGNRNKGSLIGMIFALPHKVFSIHGKKPKLDDLREATRGPRARCKRFSLFRKYNAFYCTFFW